MCLRVGSGGLSAYKRVDGWLEVAFFAVFQQGLDLKRYEEKRESKDNSQVLAS